MVSRAAACTQPARLTRLGPAGSVVMNGSMSDNKGLACRGQGWHCAVSCHWQPTVSMAAEQLQPVYLHAVGSYCCCQCLCMSCAAGSCPLRAEHQRWRTHTLRLPQSSKTASLRHVRPICRCYRWYSTPATRAAAQSTCTAAGGNLATFDSYEEFRDVEKYFIGQSQWNHLNNFWYWIGYSTQSGNVTNIMGNSLGVVNSTRSPFLHFVQYDGSATLRCVRANPRYSYQIYEWW